MPENGTKPELAECFQFPEAVRLLWEGTRKALDDWGIDHNDLVSLCDIVVRLADHRLLIIAKCGSPPESRQVADEVRRYRQMASDLRQRAGTPPAEPDWGAVEQRLRSVEVAPQGKQAGTKE